MIQILVILFSILVIILAAYRNPTFFREIVSRDGKVSSKKVFYCIAGFTATAVLLWITYKGSMEPWAFIILYSIYLVTVGGFEVMLKMMAMIIEFKNGTKPATIPEAPEAQQ